MRAEVLVGVLTAVLVVPLGAPLGVLWAWVAPRADVVPRDGALDFADPETKDFIAGDGTLFLLSIAVGLLAGALCWRLARGRPVGALLGLVVGAGLAAWVASRVGPVLDDRDAVLAAARSGRLTEPFGLPLQLRSRSVLLGLPAAAALAFGLLVLRAPAGAGAARPDYLAEPDSDPPTQRAETSWAPVRADGPDQPAGPT